MGMREFLCNGFMSQTGPDSVQSCCRYGRIAFQFDFKNIFKPGISIKTVVTTAAVGIKM
jgi:hypothetical protein